MIATDRKYRRPHRRVNWLAMGRPRHEHLGESYRHPPGYVPVYPGLTDLAALREGMDAYGRREMLSTNPHAGRTKAYGSWIDGWLWAASRDCPFVPPNSGDLKWKRDGREWQRQRPQRATA